MARQLQNIQEYQQHPTDVGSSEVQIARLTLRIQDLTKHLQTHPKDFHTRYGLQNMVSQRRRLPKYLQKTKMSAYLQLIAKLGLRN